MDAVWVVPVGVAALGTLPLAYLVRVLAREVGALRREVARTTEVRTAVEDLRAEVYRSPAPEAARARR